MLISFKECPVYGFRNIYIFQGYVFEKEDMKKIVKTSTAKYSTAEIKDSWHPRRRERSIISAGLVKRRTVAYPLIPARSYALGNPRGSPWRHFVDRLGALRERNTGSYHAKRVPWCELRETERKRDKRKKNKRKNGVKRERKKGEMGRNLRRTSRGRDERKGRKGERKKGRNIRRGGTRNDRDPGGTGIFSSRCIDARKNGVKAPPSLPPTHPPRRHVLRRFPLAPRPTSTWGRWAQQRGGRPRGETAAAAAESRRGRIREDGRHSNLSWQACLPAWLACLPACSLARLSARRLPSHRPKAGPRYTEWHTDDRNTYRISRAIRPIDFYFGITMNRTVEKSARNGPKLEA